ncbi:MAG: ABC transporter ATP-binding protein/permease [Lachnospiraceae bacterium]|nr:ABC transporter ATP-binding protein/permease [Lachnospiraceae bacterium]
MRTKEATDLKKNIRWVLGSIYKYDKSYIPITLVLTCLFALLSPAATVLIQKIMNSIQEREGIVIIVRWISVYVGLDLLQGGVEYWFGYYKLRFSQNYDLFYKRRVLEEAEKLSLKDYENSQTYDMISKAQLGGEGKARSFFDTLVNLIASIAEIITYLIIIIRFRSWLAWLVMTVPIAKYIISSRINEEQFNAVMRRTNEARKGWYYEHILVNGEAYKELKLYRLFKYFRDRFYRINEDFNREDLQIKKKETMEMGAITLMESCIDGGIYFFVISECISGKILLGNLTAYMRSVEALKSLVTSFLQTLALLKQNSMYIDSLRCFLQLADETEPSSNCEIGTIDSIEVKHLYYRYRQSSEYVLKDVNFSIKRNERIAIVGQNGSGKSTLLKIIMGFYEDYEGEVYINGVELRDIDNENLMKHIAALFQDFFRYEATVRENIAFGNIEHMDDDEYLLQEMKKVQADELATEKGLDTQIGYLFDEGRQLSLGQWQRVGLARAFIKDADLYILDEPNAALDPIAEYQLAQLYKSILLGKIGIVVAHRFQHLIIEMDKILVMDEGKIVGIGSHDELINSNKVYRAMYNIQMKGKEQGRKK